MYGRIEPEQPRRGRRRHHIRAVQRLRTGGTIDEDELAVVPGQNRPLGDDLVAIEVARLTLQPPPQLGPRVRAVVSESLLLW